jgi:hypothetical protein
MNQPAPKHRFGHKKRPPWTKATGSHENSSPIARGRAAPQVQPHYTPADPIALYFIKLPQYQGKGKLKHIIQIQQNIIFP